MAKQKKNRKVSQANTRWYCLGYKNGENQLEQKTLKALRQVNNILYEEVTRLDRNKPVTGVLLNYNTIDRVIEALPKRDHRVLIKRLKRMRAEARKNDNLAVLLTLEEIINAHS